MITVYQKYILLFLCRLSLHSFFMSATTFAGVVGAFDVDKRIISGSDTTIETHPWQISLQGSFGHTCGGSIIDGKWVVTAAHCVDGSSPSSLHIIAGTSKLSAGGTRRDIVRIVPHPDYNGFADGYPNDIALLELSEELSFGNKINKIETADDSDDFDDVMCTISGWGQTDNGMPDTLQEVSMTAIQNTACSDSWGSSMINAGHICIGSSKDIQDEKSACFGDSGGPMVCKSKLAGATSWGSGSCSGNPNVYTRVSHFRAWIKEVTGL